MLGWKAWEKVYVVVKPPPPEISRRRRVCSDHTLDGAVCCQDYPPGYYYALIYVKVIHGSRSAGVPNSITEAGCGAE